MTAQISSSFPAISLSHRAPSLEDVEGHCSGRLLYRWAPHLQQRFGERACETVRRRLGASSASLPDTPRSAEWIPVAVQLQVMTTILEQLHDHDVESMYRAVYEDTQRILPRGSRLVLRSLGLRRVLAKAPGLHRRLYDVGVVHVERERRVAVMKFRDAALFEQPMWRTLQGFATRMLFEMMGKPRASIVGEDAGPGGYDLKISW